MFWTGVHHIEAIRPNLYLISPFADILSVDKLEQTAPNTSFQANLPLEYYPLDSIQSIGL